MGETTPRHLDIEALQEHLRQFAAARDWEQFHTPKNLTMALAGESGELLEIFQWLTEQESVELSEIDMQRAAEEIADVQIYLLRLADILGVSIPESVARKLRANDERYPVELSKGNATKHSRRGEA
jgi:dCTP diphosphatase